MAEVAGVSFVAADEELKDGTKAKGEGGEQQVRCDSGCTDSLPSIT